MLTFPQSPASILLSLLLACSSFAAYGDDEAEDIAKPVKPLAFNVEPGVSVTVDQTDLNSLIVHTNNGAVTQTLAVPFDDSGGQPYLQAVDFNFDGHKDLAWVLPMGMVNEVTQIFLYDPSHRAFVPLQLPVAEGKPQASCDPLSTVTVDASQKTLISACRGGPTWTDDTYRYTPAGQLYLYEVKSALPLTPTDEGPAWVVHRYDAGGQQVAQRITAYNGQQAMINVKVRRLTLYSEPSIGPSRRYLVKGDSLEISAITKDEQWLKVRYMNAKKGVVEGWVAISDVEPQDGADHDQTP